MLEVSLLRISFLFGFRGLSQHRITPSPSLGELPSPLGWEIVVVHISCLRKPLNTRVLLEPT